MFDSSQPLLLDEPFDSYFGEGGTPVVHVLGDHVFTQTSDLRVYDVSGSGAPQHQGRLKLSGDGVLALQDGLAVVPGSGRLALVDLGTKEAASLLGGYTMDGQPNAIACRHPYAFVAASGGSLSANRGLVVIDATDCGDPQIVYTDSPWSLADLALDGDWVYGLRTDFVGGQWVYVVQVIDISAPLAPVAMGSCELPNYCSGLDYADGHVYAARVEAGLQIVSVADPAHPQIVGAMPTGDSALDVAVQAGVAYIANRYAGLRIVDVSNPASPATLSTLNLGGYCGSVDVQGTRAAAADANYDLAVVDVANPSAPALLGTVLTRGFCAEVTLRGDNAFVAGYNNGLELVDLSDPAQPRLVGNVVTPEYVEAVGVGDDCIFLAEQQNGYGGFQVAPLPCTITAVGDLSAPSALGLAAYPNPFNPQTTFRFTLPAAGPVRLEIIDIAGSRVATPLSGQVFTAGTHTLSWRGLD